MNREIEVVIREAFALGFMVSCEGWNSECMISDLAPDGLWSDMWGGEHVDEAVAEISGRPEFARLADLAVERLRPVT